MRSTGVPAPDGVVGAISPSHATAAKLNAAIENVMLSLPADVRDVIRDVRVYIADLGLTDDGRQIHGITQRGGNTIWIDSETLDSWPEGPLENLLGHEFSHAVRERQGVAVDDYDAEEEHVRRLAKSWGFRQPKHRREIRVRQ